MHNKMVDTRRLHVLLELSRHGSMRAVAEMLDTTTSSVSQHIAALARDVGTALVEPDGRRVRLTPAGRRLAEHAVTILAAVEAARVDLDADAEPVGTVRVSGFVTAIRDLLLPIVVALAQSHPKLTIVVYEHEPAEAFGLLATDAIDLALTYDYNLAPAGFDATLDSVALSSARWGLGVPSGAGRTARGNSLAVFNAFRAQDWIGNSRNRADEDVVHLIASMAGFRPRVTHQCDSLDLVEELIVAGMGVGMLPAERRTRRGVALLPLAGPEVLMRTYAVTRRGRDAWPPLALVLDRLRA